MKKTNHQVHETNFWFGFALGATAGVSALFLLGTEHGRDRLKKLIKLSENLEDNLGEIMTELKDKGVQIEEKVLEVVEQKAEEGGIQNVIDKIKSFSQTKKEVKKFFVKD